MSGGTGWIVRLMWLLWACLFPVWSARNMICLHEMPTSWENINLQITMFAKIEPRHVLWHTSSIVCPLRRVAVANEGIILALPSVFPIFPKRYPCRFQVNPSCPKWCSSDVQTVVSAIPFIFSIICLIIDSRLIKLDSSTKTQIQLSKSLFNDTKSWIYFVVISQNKRLPAKI